MSVYEERGIRCNFQLRESNIRCDKFHDISLKFSYNKQTMCEKKQECLRFKMN